MLLAGTGPMARPPACRKLHRSFTNSVRRVALKRGAILGNHAVATLAMTMFVAPFAFGGQYFGWTDPVGRVQPALFSAFVFGIICGCRATG
ncbi:hypothetical protein ACVWZA_004087 [Sphingomonas sp. UYAg733]